MIHFVFHLFNTLKVIKFLCMAGIAHFNFVTNGAEGAEIQSFLVLFLLILNEKTSLFQALLNK